MVRWAMRNADVLGDQMCGAPSYLVFEAPVPARETTAEPENLLK
jgi:hypothetical protein